jgi:CHASE1-domain containing sensor protein
MAVAVLVAGTAVAAFAASAVAGTEVERSHRAFATSAAGIASGLQLDIQHEQDLSVSLGGFVTGRPNASNAEFLRWTSSVRAFERYPELEGLGATVVVTDAQLPAFAARAAADATQRSSSRQEFQVIPPGKRPFYCFATLAQTTNPALVIPAGFDYCASSPDISS